MGRASRRKAAQRETENPAPKQGPVQGNDTSWFLAALSVFLVPLVFVLQANGVLEIGPVWSAMIYLAVILLICWAYLRWSIPKTWSREKRVGVLAAICFGLIALSCLGVSQEYKRTVRRPLEMEIYNAAAPTLIVKNTSDHVEENITWDLVLYRSRDDAYFSFYPVPDQTIPFVKAHSKSGPVAMDLESILKFWSGGDKQMRNGDVFTGILALKCASCDGSMYIVQFTWEQSGWIYHVSDSEGGLIYPIDMSAKGVANFISNLETQAKEGDRETFQPAYVIQLPH